MDLNYSLDAILHVKSDPNDKNEQISKLKHYYLSPHNKQLLVANKYLVKAGRIKCCWFNDGRVRKTMYIKHSQTS